MSTFDHAGLIQGINESLATFRKAQPETMRGFSQLAQASMAEGELSSKHKELIALAIGVTQRCSGCSGRQGSPAPHGNHQQAVGLHQGQQSARRCQQAHDQCRRKAQGSFRQAPSLHVRDGRPDRQARQVSQGLQTRKKLALPAFYVSGQPVC